MSYRFMRMIVFFDLPTLTSHDMREYRKFRKMLLKDGFFMMQESVYCKMALNYNIVERTRAHIKQNKPSAGVVQFLVITEKQFSKIDYIVGENNSAMLATDDRVTVI